MKKISVALFFLTAFHTVTFSQTVRKNNIEYSAVSLSKKDKIFLALKDTAQKHLRTFIDNLNKHGRDSKNYQFAVKSDFVQDGNHEHMWSRIFEYRNGFFRGIFIDSAFTVKNIKRGNKVNINKREIEDWLIHNEIDGKTAGGFSRKYLQSKKKAGN